MSRALPTFCAFLACTFSALAATDVPAPTPSGPVSVDSPERREALKLYEENKMAQAVPLLEKLTAEYPQDAVLMERYGVAMISYAATMPDADSRKLATVKAREILLKAKALGDNSNLLNTILNETPADGNEPAFSANKEAREAMDQAEADFARGDLDKALGGYQRALTLDPNIYEAALFSGDACYKLKQNALAYKWYARAVEINPDYETAYRYWGDSCMVEGKMDDARTKFMQAVVAQPYVDRSWTGLGQWAEANNVKLIQHKLQNQSSATTSGSSTTIQVATLSKEKDPAAAGWLAYGLVRALWQTEKFKKTFPAETTYRHSLPEETEALRSLLKALDETPKNEWPFSSDLMQLIEIDKAGLLEPYILLERPDEGIAQDYAAYRAAHRDLLFQYLDKFVVPKTPPRIP